MTPLDNNGFKVDLRGRDPQRYGVWSFIYKNWRGETRHRWVYVHYIWYGFTEYHKENQFLLHGVDCETLEHRDFAMEEMTEIRQHLFYWDTAKIPPPEVMLGDVKEMPVTKNKLGRFGHHDVPAVDFQFEVQAIRAQVLQFIDGELDGEVIRLKLEDRIYKAMAFVVGGDRSSIASKEVLREYVQKFKDYCKLHYPSVETAAVTLERKRCDEVVIKCWNEWANARLPMQHHEVGQLIAVILTQIRKI